MSDGTASSKPIVDAEQEMSQLMEQADRLVDNGGEDARVMSILDRVLAIGTCAEANWWRGQLYFKRGDYAKAVQDFDVVVVAWGDSHADVYAQRAVAHAMLRSNAQAAADVASLWRVDPRNHWFHHYLQRLLDQGDLEVSNLLLTALKPAV